MKKFALFLSLILSTLAFSSLGCGGNQILSFSAFNTIVRIEARDKAITKDTENKIKNLFSELERDFDANDQNSLIYAFNTANENQSITVSDKGKELILLSKELYSFTDGAFNPAVYTLVALWQFNDYPVLNFSPPTDQAVTQILDSGITDFDKVILTQNQLSKTDGRIKMDFGGILKGYAVEKALDIMTEAGHNKGYISLGSSSIALLSVESLNVSHPRKTDEKPILLTVDCSNKNKVTLSTSGDYERAYDYNGKRYSHVINPKTGKPIDGGVISATVIGGSGAFSDAVTTALLTLEHTPNDTQSSKLISMMKKLISSEPSLELYVVYDDGNIKQLLTNEKQGESFTLLDAEYSVVNI